MDFHGEAKWSGKMIIGTYLGMPAPCGCNQLYAGRFGVPRASGPKLPSPYNIMRSGKTPRWYGKDPRYMLTNVDELIRRATQP